VLVAAMMSNAIVAEIETLEVTIGVEALLPIVD